MDNDFEANLGISRRTVIKRGAIVGGTLMWAAPAVRTISRAGAQSVGTAPCNPVFCGLVGTTVFRCFPTNPSQSNCLCECDAGSPATDPNCPNNDPCQAEITCVKDPTCNITS